MDKMDKYINYDSTSQLHRELTNIVLLCVEDSSSLYYCYCGEEYGDCGLCQMTLFSTDPFEENLMEGLTPRKFLAKNYNKRARLEEFALKILPFFEKMDKDHDPSLDFFRKDYSWSFREKLTGKTLHVDLDEAVENEILSAKEE